MGALFLGASGGRLKRHVDYLAGLDRAQPFIHCRHQVRNGVGLSVWFRRYS